MDEKIGLVLSGGGVKAIAHIGLIEVLLENGIVPTIVSGTSAGAMIGAMYAANYSPNEMLSFFEETPLFKISFFARNKPGFLDSQKYIKYFDKLFNENSFEELKYPLIIPATNIVKANITYFNSGELIRPIIASAALPPLFSPVEIDGELYSDGGILDNFPVDPIKDKCDKIIGSFVNPVTEIDKSEIDTAFKLLYRVYHIGMDVTDIQKFKHCNYVFTPNNLDNIGPVDAKSIRKSYQLGYKYAQKEIKTILKAMI
jgi:NTE family protein